MSRFRLKNQAATPSTPSAGEVSVYTATATKRLASVDELGVVTLYGSGDVVGPAGATDEAIARYDGVTGKLLQNSGATLSDAGSIRLPAAQTIARAGGVGLPFVLAAQATGDLIYFDGTNWIRLGIGTAAQVLAVSGGIPTWTTPSSAAGFQVYWGNGSVAATTTTRYLSPGFDPGTASTVRVAVVCTNPGTIDRLFVRHDSASGNGLSIVYTLRKNAAAQAVTVSLATGAVGTGSDVANSFAVVAGDIVDLEITKAASVATSPANVYASYRFTPS